MTNLKSWQNSLNQIFNKKSLFFFFLTAAIWYYHAIYIVLKYFAWFTGYENDIFEVISNLDVQGSKFGGKVNKFGGKSKKKLNSTEFMEFVFSRSVQTVTLPYCHNVTLSYSHTLILSQYCHTFIISHCRTLTMSSCNTAKLSKCHTVWLSVKDPGNMPTNGIVIFGLCPAGWLVLDVT